MAVTPPASPAPGLRRFCLATDDPALHWLGQPARWLLSSSGRSWEWIAALIPICVLFFRPFRHTPGGTHLTTFIGVYALSFLALWGARFASGGPGLIRRALGRRLLERRARDLARQVDATALEAVPDGAIVIATGRVRGRQHLAHRVAGRACVGVSIRCRAGREELALLGPGGRRFLVADPPRTRTRWYAAFSEALCEFDLDSPDGRSIFVPVADARVLAAPNVDFLGGDIEERMLVASLELPMGAIESSRGAFALRDGDVVAVIGFKQTLADPGAPDGNERHARLRAAIGSSGSLPLLIIAGT